MTKAVLTPVDVNYLVVTFEQVIDPQVNRQVRLLWQQLQHHQSQAGIVAMIPTYCTLQIQFDPHQTDSTQVSHLVHELILQSGDIKEPQSRKIEVPVTYGGELGPDIMTVARHNGLTQDQVIDIHTAGEYLVYMLGFNPGFPYMGGLDPRLHTPRLEVPRTRVKAGSVGIAGAQTGIYSTSSPGGWQLIGHTQFHLFNPTAQQPVLLQPGDIIKFVAI